MASYTRTFVDFMPFLFFLDILVRDEKAKRDFLETKGKETNFLDILVRDERQRDSKQTNNDGDIIAHTQQAGGDDGGHNAHHVVARQLLMWREIRILRNAVSFYFFPLSFFFFHPQYFSFSSIFCPRLPFRHLFFSFFAFLLVITCFNISFSPSSSFFYIFLFSSPIP